MIIIEMNKYRLRQLVQIWLT